MMRSSLLTALMVCGGVMMVAAPADAGVDVDFGARVRVGDDADLFFAISSRYFDRDRAVVENWGRRFTDPDDLAVALFIGRHSGMSLEFIFSLRRGGASWWDIGVRAGVPANVWFVPVPRDPGPPYGKAYGYWKKHRNSPRSIMLADVDVRNLVAVRMLHDYYGMPVDVAMEYRSSGRDLRHLAAQEYRGRHATRPDGQAHAPGKQPKRGKPGKGRKK